jgi:hypothetical protein
MELKDILETYDEKFDVETFMKNVLKLKKRFELQGLNVNNLSLLLVSLMTEVQKIAELRGSEKKMLVTQVLTKLVEDLVPDKDTTLEEVLKLMIPGLIDNITELWKLKAKSNKILNCCFSKNV